MSTPQTKEAACHVILVLPIYPREKSKLKLPFEWILELLLCMHACMDAFLWDISRCPCHQMHSSHPHIGSRLSQILSPNPNPALMASILVSYLWAEPTNKLPSASLINKQGSLEHRPERIETII
jgi:hypothetical protein